MLIVALAWLGGESVSPGLAAHASGTPQSNASLLSYHKLPPRDPYLPERDSHSVPDTPSLTEAPELLLPDLRTLPPYDLEIVTMPDGSRELRLSNTIWNSGMGPLELEGEPNPDTQQTRVVQHIYTQADELVDHLVGEFVWHPKHDHWHFEDFSLYELWTLTSTGGLGKIISSSDKISYCVIDTDVLDSEKAGFPPHKHYNGCGRALQGLSVGWGDTYKSFLDGQSIQLAAAEDGFFALKSTANPEGILVEANYRNNAALVYLEIRGERVELIDPAEFVERQCKEPKGWIVQDLFCRV